MPFDSTPPLSSNSSSSDESEIILTPHNELETVTIEENDGKKRYITNYPGARYILPFDSEEKQRLTRQHFLLKNLFRSNLLAPVEYEDGDEVLDIGAGTGVWILDYSSSLNPDTKVHFHGIDIESRLFPSPPLPENIDFSIQSVINLPEAWSNKFTVVHQRLLIVGLTRENWVKGIREIFRVVKPGGYVELCEHTSTFIGGESYLEFWKQLTDFYDSMGLVGHCSKFLQQWLTEAGFVDVHYVEEIADTGAWAGEEGEGHRDNLINVYRALKPTIVRNGGMGVKSEEEMEARIERMKEDMDQHGSKVGWVRCWARKPE